MISDMLENSLINLKPMNRLEVSILLLITKLSWWLMKKEKHINCFNRFTFSKNKFFRVDSNLISKKKNNFF